MSERYSLSDKQVYGAEDDEEMDAIMRVLDRASDAERPKSEEKK